MTPEAINRAIAEWCGWKLCTAPVKGGVNHSWWEHPGKERYGKRPDYYHDLNAVHEAVNALPPQERPTFQHHLDVMCATSKDPHCSCWDFIQATAPQRCEALLRAIGRWGE